MKTWIVGLVVLWAATAPAQESAKQFATRSFARIAKVAPDDFEGYEKYLRDVCHPDYIFIDRKGGRFELDACIESERRESKSGVQYLKTQEVSSRWESHGPDYAVLTATHDFDMRVPKGGKGGGFEKVRRRNTTEFTLILTPNGWKFIQERLLKSEQKPL